jgi:hypothetical protein
VIARSYCCCIVLIRSASVASEVLSLLHCIWAASSTWSDFFNCIFPSDHIVTGISLGGVGRVCGPLHFLTLDTTLVFLLPLLLVLFRLLLLLLLLRLLLFAKLHYR